MPLIAEIVDGAKLVQVIWISALAGIGVTASFALALHGATRGTDLRRDGHLLAAGAYYSLCVAGLVVVFGAIVLGIVAMSTK